MSFEKMGPDVPFMEFMRGVLFVTKGRVEQGLNVLESTSDVFLKNGSLWNHVTTEHTLGNIYLQAALEEESGMQGFSLQVWIRVSPPRL